MQSNLLRAEIVSIDTLRAYDKHHRIHSVAQRERLRRFVADFGQVDPVIIDDEGTVIDGHLLLEVLREAGFQQVAVRRAEEFSRTQQRTLRIARNQLSQGASWDASRLATELTELEALDVDLAATGLSDAELQRLLEVTSVDDQGKTHSIVSQHGDIWCLGRHRVACDTSLSGLATILYESSVRVAWLNEESPQSEGGGDRSNCRSLRDLGPTLNLLRGKLHNGAAIVVPCDNALDLGPILQTARECDLEHVAMAVVSRPTPSDGSFYRSEHIPVCFFRFGTGDFVTSRRRSRSARGDLWISSGCGGCEPIASAIGADTIAEVLRDVSRKGDVVVVTAVRDGSTVLAAETTGRTCIGIDRAPAAIDAVIRDWQRASGEVARHAESGMTYSEVKATRERTSAYRE